jgi:pyrroloquinoline quinone biosynthesis protein D
MSLPNRPRRKSGYRLEMIDNELLLFHPAQAQILYCNETASLIWQLCDGQRTPQEIMALLAAAYPEAADTITEDVAATLGQFSQHGAIEFV